MTRWTKWVKVIKRISQSCSIREDGYSLLVLAVLLTIIGGLVAVIVSLSPHLIKKKKGIAEQAVLAEVDKQLEAFAVLNGRLPCPDITGNGIEDCGGVAKGALPHRTLKLGGVDATLNRVEVGYTVYRNGGIDADLALLVNRFEPTDADGLSASLSNVNTLDFCIALENGDAASQNTAFAHILNLDGTSYNIAYGIAHAGMLDKDSSGNPFDGFNASDPLAFDAPQRQEGPAYDDHVAIKSFQDMREAIQCDVTMDSLDLIASAVAVETEVESLADAVEDTATFAAITAGVMDLVLIAKTAIGVAAVATASATLGTASTFLAAAIATCVASLGATCGEVAVGVAAVAAAGTAVATAAVGVGLNAAAVVQQSIALAMIIEVTGKTGSTHVPDDNTAAYQQLAVDARAQADHAEVVAHNAANAAYSAANTAYTEVQNSSTIYTHNMIVAAANLASVPGFADTASYTNAVAAANVAANQAGAEAGALVALEVTIHPEVVSGYNQSWANDFLAAVTSFTNAQTGYNSASGPAQAVYTSAVEVENQANIAEANRYLFYYPALRDAQEDAVNSLLSAASQAQDAAKRAEYALYDTELKLEEASIKQQNAYDLDENATFLEAAAAGGVPTGGTAIVPSSGAEDILDDADAKGVVR